MNSKVYVLRHLPSNGVFGHPTTVIAFKNWKHAQLIKRYIHHSPFLKKIQEGQTFELPLVVQSNATVRPINIRAVAIDNHLLEDAIVYYAINNLGCSVIDQIIEDKNKLILRSSTPIHVSLDDELPAAQLNMLLYDRESMTPPPSKRRPKKNKNKNKPH